MPPSITIAMVVEHMTTCSAELATNLAPPRRAISAKLWRALQIRIDALEEQQRADVEEIERLYGRSEELTYRMLERQHTLREFRHILLNRRVA